jgi:hypothetical protein
MLLVITKLFHLSADARPDARGAHCLANIKKYIYKKNIKSYTPEDGHVG